jgi:hypothetical protein
VEGFCYNGNEHNLTEGGILLGNISQYQILNKAVSLIEMHPAWPIWGYHSGVVKGSDFLGCDAVSLGEWSPTFRNNCLHLQALNGTENSSSLEP